MSRRPAPVLRPSTRPGRGPLPVAVPILSLVALAILGFYTVPAVAEHGRLERDHRRLEADAHEGQLRLQQLQRELRAERRRPTSQIRATRELMQAGATYLEERAVRFPDARAPRKPGPAGDAPRPGN